MRSSGEDSQLFIFLGFSVPFGNSFVRVLGFVIVLCSCFLRNIKKRERVIDWSHVFGFGAVSDLCFEFG